MTSKWFGIRWLRNCTPALSPFPTNFALSRNSKSPYSLVVQRNSLCSTFCSSEPATIAPFSTRKTFSFPSQPASDLPSNSDVKPSSAGAEVRQRVNSKSADNVDHRKYLAARMAVSSVVWQLQLSPQCNQIEAALPPGATVT